MYEISFSLLLFFVTSGMAKALEVSVDENIEFISAVARLAGFEEYINDINKSYTENIDSLLRPFADHESVVRLKELRGKQGVSYDAIATLGVHTTIADGHLILKDGSDLSAVDGRWKPGQDKQIVPLLDDLYRKSDFSSFFKKNNDLYDHAIANMDHNLKECDIDWLTDFYGKKLNGSRLVVSLLNCGNYGLTQELVGRPDESVIIIGCHNLDENGYPSFSNITGLIVHESSHPICNPLVENNIALFNDNIAESARLMKEQLKDGAYSGGTTMMCESMVRAMEIEYWLAHGRDSSYVDRAMKSQMAQGFTVLPEILDALRVYRENRDNYPVIDSIMPMIIDRINRLDIQQRYDEIIKGSPTITGCSIEEGAVGIAPSDSLEIKFFFDKPIKKGSFGMDYYEDNEEICPELADVSPKIKLSDDGKELTVYVIAKPGKEYGFVMPGYFYRGLTGYPGNGEAKVHFFTSGK